MMLIRFQKLIASRVTQDLWSSSSECSIRIYNKVPQHRFKCNISNESTNNYNEFEFEDCGRKEVDFYKLANGDDNKLQELKNIQMKIELWREKGNCVPKQINEREWKRIIKCTSDVSLKMLLNYYWRKEGQKRLKKEHQAIEHERYLEWKSSTPRRSDANFNLTTASPIVYDLVHNSLFFRIRKPYMERFLNYNMMKAALHAPHVVVDCSFEEYMTEQSLLFLLKDITKMIIFNKDHITPAHIIFTNVDINGRMLDELKTNYEYLFTDQYPFFWTTQSFMEMYPKNKLVYLTPDSKNPLETYDGNSVYIIGGYLNKFQEIPLTLAKAKKLKLRTASLPIGKYRIGSANVKKELSVHQVNCVLNDLKATRNWNFALRSVINLNRGVGNNNDVLHGIDTSYEPLLSSRTIEAKIRRKNAYNKLFEL